MADSTQLRFSDLIAKMEDRISKLENGNRTVQMSHTSLENTRIHSYDAAGTLRQIFGKQPDGTYAVTYGNGPVPPMPAGLTIVPRQGAVLVGWDGTFEAGAAKPADFARLDIHISETPGFAPTGATVSGYLLAESAILIPIDHVTHYVRVVAVTTSDAISTATTETAVLPEPVGEVAAGWVYAGNVTVDQLTGGTLNGDVILGSEIRTADTGARVELGPSGFTTYDSDGTPSISLPTDPLSDSVFRGNVEAGGLTVTGTAAFRSIDNEISKGASLILQSATTAPQNAPSASFSWDYVTTLAGMYCDGLAWHNGELWTGRRDGYLVSQSGTEIPLGAHRDRPRGGIVHVGTHWFSIRYKSSTNVWYISKYDDVGNWVADRIIYNGVNVATEQEPCLGSDGTNLLVAQFWPPTDNFRVQVWDTTLTFVSESFTSANAGFTGPVIGVERGVFDFGSERTVILSSSGAHYWVFDAALTYDSLEAWEITPASLPRGFAWDGTRFWAIEGGSIDPNKIYKHTTTDYYGLDKNYHATSTWRHSVNGYETTMGAVGSFTMKKRAQLTLTSPAVPGEGAADDPDSVGFYVSYDSDPTWRNGYFQQTLPAVGANSVTLGDDFVFAGTIPPDTNNFPGATPGIVTNAAGTLILSGDGSIQVTQVTTPDTWIDFTLLNGFTVAGGTPGSKKMPDKTVALRGHVNSPAANTTFAVLPVGQRPPTQLYLDVATSFAGSRTYAGARLSVSTLGELQFDDQDPNGLPPWISLDGTRFPID